MDDSGGYLGEGLGGGVAAEARRGEYVWRLRLHHLDLDLDLDLTHSLTPSIRQRETKGREINVEERRKREFG